MLVIYHKIKHRYRYKANLKGWNQVYLFILLLDSDPDWFILFPDKVSAESMWNPDTLLYLSIMNFFCSGARYERELSQAGCRFYSTLKPMKPCMRGNLTFLLFKLSKRLKWIRVPMVQRVQIRI